MQPSMNQKAQQSIYTGLKMQEKQTLTNVNPFFEYVSNNSLLTLKTQQLKTQHLTVSSVVKSESVLKSQESSLKQSLATSDPRKAVQSYVPKKLSPARANEKAQPTLNGPASRQQGRGQRSRSRQKPSRTHYQQPSQSKQQQHYHKTKLCPLYQKAACRKGSDCTYAHGEKELRGLPNFVKTRICMAFKNGDCNKTSNECRYAHGEQELRALRHDRQFSTDVYRIGFKEPKYQNQTKFTNNRQDRQKHEYKDHKRSSDSHYNRDRNYKKDSQDRSYKKDSQDRRGRDSHHDSKRDHRRHSQQKNLLKKNIPINKDYEKYLYGDAPKASEIDYLAYEIQPSSYVSLPIHDPYSINYDQQTIQIIPKSSNSRYTKKYDDQDNSYRRSSNNYVRQSQSRTRYQPSSSSSKQTYYKQKQAYSNAHRQQYAIHYSQVPYSNTAAYNYPSSYQSQRMDYQQFSKKKSSSGLQDTSKSFFKQPNNQFSQYRHSHQKNLSSFPQVQKPFYDKYGSSFSKKPTDGYSDNNFSGYSANNFGQTPSNNLYPSFDSQVSSSRSVYPGSSFQANSSSLKRGYENTPFDQPVKRPYDNSNYEKPKNNYSNNYPSGFSGR